MFVRFVALAFMAGTLAACSDATEPPFDELSLRDALDADPSVIASMSNDAQASLALRLHEAQRMQAQAGSPMRPVASDATLESNAVEALVASLDGNRATNHEEALVTATLDFAAPDPLLLAPPIGLSGNAAAGKVIDLSTLEGADPASPTADAEARALAGDAGLILADLAQQANADRFIRVSGWPVGAVAVGRTVYVNGTWLVAMASKPVSNDVPTMKTPTLSPQKVSGNPYDPPFSIDECALQVESDCNTCVATGQCDDSDLTDISDPKAACEFILADTRRAKSLCIIALFGTEKLRECVSSFDSQCLPPTEATSTELDKTIGFFENSVPCDTTYNSCLDAAHSYQWSSTCSVAGAKEAPGRKALMLFGPLVWLVVMSRIGRRGTWKAKS